MGETLTLNRDALSAAAECLRTLAHPLRLRIVEMLLSERHTVGQIAAACQIPSHHASGHLKLMQRCGLLKAVREGKHVYYQIDEPCLAKFMACIRERFGSEQSE
ncbi:MAG: metalloregulator ArsR/SmtB family transcription factor [Phycisphaerae bacterium]|nr:metalloregulator ArsR/SmtB family transcription factor [Phycisphaerae bacterium]MDW8261728.1 metalloregulator ArsR/SmtB family transcription factor [Phycisphaerales bacterium]